MLCLRTCSVCVNVYMISPLWLVVLFNGPGNTNMWGIIYIILIYMIYMMIWYDMITIYTILYYTLQTDQKQRNHFIFMDIYHKTVLMCNSFVLSIRLYLCSPFIPVTASKGLTGIIFMTVAILTAPLWLTWLFRNMRNMIASAHTSTQYN